MEVLDRAGFEPFEAPASDIAVGPLAQFELLRAMRENLLQIYGGPAFDELNLTGKFLNKRSLLTNDPDVVRDVLVDRPEAFRRTGPTMRILAPILGNGLFLSEGAAWRFQRRTMAPAFAPRALDIVASVASASATRAIDRLILAQAGGSGPHDLMRVMQDIALDVAASAMFSMPLDGGRRTRLRGLFEGYGAAVGRPFPLDMILPRNLPSPADFKRMRLGRKWLNFIQALLEERARLPAGGKPRDLYDLLIAVEDAETGRAFTRNELRDQFATMIIAGHETTALTLLWAMIMIAHSPPLGEALAVEAGQLDLDCGVSSKTIDRLPLARAVIMECLRLFPPAFLIVREAAQPVRLAGRILFKGDLVSIPPWTLQRHRRHWRNPALFDPRRFSPHAEPPKKFTYLPFGAGPRICIGMRFALIEAAIVIARFARAFDLGIRVDQPIKARAVVTTYPDPMPTFDLRLRKMLASAA